MSATVILHNTQVEKITTFRKVDPNNCTRFYAASFFRRIRKLEIIITIYIPRIFYILLRFILNGFWYDPIHHLRRKWYFIGFWMTFTILVRITGWGLIKKIVIEFFYELLLYEPLGSEKNRFLLRYVDKFTFWMLSSYVIRYF